MNDNEADAMVKHVFDKAENKVSSKNVDAGMASEHQLEIPEKRNFNIVRIGNIAFDNGGGSYAGCKMMRWEDTDGVRAADAFNAFFAENANLMVVADPVFSADGCVIHAMVSNTLNDAQMEVIKTRSSIIEGMVQEIMEKKEAQIKAEEDATETEYERLKALATVGEHCEKNHGGVIKQMRAKAKGKK